MAPWGSDEGGVVLRPESLPLSPMRATLLPALASGGPTRVVAEGFSVPSDSPVGGGRVTRSGRYMASPRWSRFNISVGEVSLQETNILAALIT